MFKVLMMNTINYLVVVGGEETWFLSSYLKSQHSHQRQSSDVCVDAIVPPVQ
jgi:plastocyanin domain-containing protein